jgi:high-affinity nickel-transport protein
VLTAIGLGLLLGIRHAADPDHLVAVSAIAAGGGGRARSARVGLVWGLGHAATVLVLGGALVALGLQVPARLGLGLEGLVGAVLIALGISNLRRRPTARDHAPLPRSLRRSFWVGAVHGLAGTGGLAVLAVAAMPTAAAAVAYLAVFGIGSVAGMLTVSLGLGVPLRWASARPRAAARLAWVSGAAALAFGTWMVWRVGSGGLL